MNQKMPDLYNKILEQPEFQKDFDVQLAIDNRVKHEMEEIDALKA